MSKMAYRCIAAKWKSQKLIEREVSIKLLGIDSMGLVNGITEIISKENHVNMKGISFDTNDGFFTGIIKIMIFDTIHLDSLIKKLKGLEGVEDVSRHEIDESA